MFRKVDGEPSATGLASKSSSRSSFRKRKSANADEDEPGVHKVTFTVTIAQAVPSGNLIIWNVKHILKKKFDFIKYHHKSSVVLYCNNKLQ